MASGAIKAFPRLLDFTQFDLKEVVRKEIIAKSRLTILDDFVLAVVRLSGLVCVCVGVWICNINI